MGRGDTPVPSPPWTLHPNGRPPSPGNPTMKAQETTGDRDPLQTMKVKKETHRRAKQAWPPGVGPSNPRPTQQCPQRRRQKGKVAARRLENRIPTQDRHRRRQRRGGPKRRGHCRNKSGPWARRQGPRRSSAWSQRRTPTSRNHWWAWSAPSSDCCVQGIGFRPCASANAVFAMSPSISSSEQQAQAEPTGTDARCASLK